VRIHLGHHFYGAGNLGDDFMLAGFLTAMRTLAPTASFTACVPFPLEPLQRRFPEVDWHGYDEPTRRACIAACDAWLGLGGSPFQSAQSRWFIDHLIGDAAICQAQRKPMFFLGVGVQTEAELAPADVRNLCAQTAAIWTRSAASAERLAACGANVQAAADLAHVYFQRVAPPAIVRQQLTLVPNFDYDAWIGMPAMLEAIDRFAPNHRVWLAQESRELPGAERALYATMSAAEQSKWQLAVADTGELPLATALQHWPSSEWLITSRFHAAIAGSWAGSKIIVIAINEKLREAAHELSAPEIGPDAGVDEIVSALRASLVPRRPTAAADAAFNACREFVAAIRG
jgi:polysaccharide pyruvyl transferase WcaK-like protein